MKLYENLEPSLQLKMLIAKIRNVCYYRAIDDRPRAQYMHVFRGLRADVSTVLHSLPQKLQLIWGEKLVGVLRIIPPKIKTHDCAQVANNLAQYVETTLRINWSRVNY